MNKKGFTLIELLSTITIMTLIATIASINIIKILDEKELENKKREESIIEKAACVYIELNKNKELKENCLTIGCDIDTDTLIKEGLIDEKEISKKERIHIEKENLEKKCTMK